MMRSNALSIIALVTALAFVPDAQAANKVKKFKVNGGGNAPLGASVFGFDSPHDATGNGIGLGKYSGSGIFNSLSFFPADLEGTFEGVFDFVKPNGDRLACTYGDTDNGAASAGFYFAMPAAGGKFVIVFCAEFNPIPELCTGKFANVVGGSFTMLAISEPIDLTLDAFGYTPPFKYTWDGEGTLTFAK